jgi:hypothetical protein
MGTAAAAAREHYETISRGFPFAESLRSEGRAPRGTRAASGHHSFSDCALYSERRLRGTGNLAQATGFCIGRLLQSPRRRADRSIGDRHWLGSVAMATRRRDPQGQLTAAYDLRADFGVANLLSLLDALAPPRERHPAARRLFRSDIARADDDHAHWTSRWNPQRR